MINPKKGQEINEGRKRIDIMYTNAAQDGFFHRVMTAPQIAALKIPVECKNYTKDAENPEVDQLTGRFAPNRGWMGFLLYRSTMNYDLLVIPSPVEQNPWAQSRRPMDMMRQG